MENLDKSSKVSEETNKETKVSPEATLKNSRSSYFEVNHTNIESDTTIIGNIADHINAEEPSQYKLEGNAFIGPTYFGSQPVSIKRETQESIRDYIQEYIPSVKKINEKIDDEIKMLEESRIIILDSFVSDYLNSTLASIVTHEKYADLKKKRLNFIKADYGDIFFHFRSLVVELAKDQNTLLTFFTNTTTSCALLFEQILTNDFIAAIGEYRTLLINNNSYIIIAVFDQINIRRLNEISSIDFIDRKHLPFLNHLLLKLFDKDSASELNKKITIQRSKGKWSKDDFKFYEEITRSLQKGIEHFNQIVADDTSSVEGFREEDKNEAIQLIDHEDKLIRYISFVAANFDELSLNEFQYVVQTLLNDPEKTEIIPNPLKPEEKIEQMLLKRWNETGDHLLRLLHLKEQLSDTGDGKILRFEKQGFVETFKEEFSSAFNLFSQQQFNYLFFDRGLLFNDDTPYKIMENFIQISAEIATRDSDMYCQRLLMYTTFSIINQKANIDFKIDPDTDNFEEAFEEFLEYLNEKHSELEIQKLEAFRKIGLLIAKMYSYQNLRNRINKYFNLLIEYRFYNAVFVLVRYLKNIPDFDSLYWIKQLLDRGIIVVKKEVFRFLTWFLFQSNLKVIDFLEVIKKWYLGKSVINSDSASTGICAIIDYMFISIDSIPFMEYGRFPLKLNFFTTVESEEDGKERIEFLVDWLLNPELKKAYVSLDSFFERATETKFNQGILALLLIRLKAVFTGIQWSKTKEIYSDFSIQLGEQFIEAVVKKATRVQRSEIIEGVQQYRSYYSDRKKEEATNSKENRDIFDSLSKISSNVINHFNRHTNFKL